ncbi:MAG TPA: HAD family phosphatase [Verrucomicrobiota bacterium]|nr:HAD family phosphatase [Verrucomicrobiota bacterium]|tara:strand:- start:360 stop:965 length:606 start_codon:yes stop_codon:yes gene_type:complete
MRKPSVVVFDLGKVLVDFDYSIAVRRFAERSEAGMEQIQRLVDSPIQNEYESGKITTDEFFEAIRDGAGFSGDRAEFVSIFADIFSPMETMIGFFDRLKSLGFPTCVFSNTNEIAIGHIRERFPFYGRFGQYVLSFEEGGMKPDEPIYDVVEQRTDESGAGILYIDDRPENIETGRGRGWQTILQSNEAASVSAAESALGL